MAYMALLKKIWQALYDPKENVAEIIEKYFHSEYEQCINGVAMKRSEYIQHVLAQRQSMVVNSIEYKNFLEQGDELFAIYYPKGKSLNNTPMEAEVIAYFCFKDQKILKIHGQVRLITGNLADADM